MITGIIIGLVAGFVLAVVLAAVSFFLSTRRKREDYPSEYEFDPITRTYKRKAQQ